VKSSELCGHRRAPHPRMILHMLMLLLTISKSRRAPYRFNFCLCSYSIQKYVESRSSPGTLELRRSFDSSPPHSHDLHDSCERRAEHPRSIVYTFSNSSHYASNLELRLYHSVCVSDDTSHWLVPNSGMSITSPNPAKHHTQTAVNSNAPCQPLTSFMQLPGKLHMPFQHHAPACAQSCHMLTRSVLKHL
jgi:hypothetical protein